MWNEIGYRDFICAIRKLQLLETMHYPDGKLKVRLWGAEGLYQYSQTINPEGVSKYLVWNILGGE